MTRRLLPRLALLLALAALVAAVAGSGALADPDTELCPIDPDTGLCMPDVDHDGITDVLDNCPGVYNPLQQDADHDGLGDACDSTPNGSGGGGGGGGGGTSCTGTATLYENTGYGGSCWGFSGQVPYVGDSANDRASSIQVAPGYVATLFSDANFQGASASTRTASDFSGWGSVGNDRVSSLVVQPDDPTSAYYDGAGATDVTGTSFELANGNGCAGVADSVKWSNPIRTQWTYTVRLRFCWKANKITSVYSREIAANIASIPFPFNLIQEWQYTPISEQDGEPGYSSTIMRVQGQFQFCTFKIGCMLTQQPWIRIEVFGSGRATCATLYRQDAHPCVRF